MSDVQPDGSQSPTVGIQVLYTELALHPRKDFGWDKGKENARNLGYDAGWLNDLPDVVWESAAAGGNPFSLGSITLRATGIDITPTMVDKAKKNTRLLGLRNVEVHVADIASVPLEDACADVVISNG